MLHPGEQNRSTRDQEDLESIMFWKLQSLIWKFLPANRSVSFSLVVFGLFLVSCVIVFVIGRLWRKRWVSRIAIASAAAILFVWGFLFITRPMWLRIATQNPVPTPTVSALHWERRTIGLETAELVFYISGVVVDRMMLVRLDPQCYQFSIHWDPTGTRTAEEWQREFGATVVVNGSYFGHNFVPLTPLRTSGHPAGPTTYDSTHGAFVAHGHHVDILDLQDLDVFKTINPFPDAMVSYPLLIDHRGENRAIESKTWLASRNFVAIDGDKHVVLGTTETGFFTLYRLGEFLKDGPLELRVALNLDGGPLVSQIVQAGEFTRHFHGKSEISNSSDVLRVFWHTYSGVNWTLPIVLIAQPISS